MLARLDRVDCNKPSHSERANPLQTISDLAWQDVGASTHLNKLESSHYSLYGANRTEVSTDGSIPFLVLMARVAQLAELLSITTTISGFGSIVHGLSDY